MIFKKLIAVAAAAAMAMSLCVSASAEKAAGDTTTLTGVSGTFTLYKESDGTAAIDTSASTITLTDATSSANNGKTEPESYLVYTASETGTLSITFSSSVTNTKNNKPRLYSIVTTALAEGTTLTKENIANLSETTYKQATDANTDTAASISVTAGNSYYIFPYVYGKSGVVFTLKNISFTAADSGEEETTAAAGAWTSLETFSGDVYDGEATALKFSITPGSDTITSLKVSKGSKSAEKTDLSLSGGTTYVYGVVIDEIVSADDITVAADDTTVEMTNSISE